LRKRKETMMSEQSYLLDNAWRQGRARLDAVEAFLDPGTIALLDRIGVATSWHCLELGAGGGSIADWLARRVGVSGRVVATDLDTRHLAVLSIAPEIEVRRHDIVTEPLEERAFDLIHARLVLEHLPERDRLLPKLVRALRPGGWLLVESVDYVSAVPVSELGAREHERSQAIRLRQFEGAGIKFDLGRHLPRMLRENELAEIANEGRVFVMEGGSPGALWFQLSMEQLRPGLVGSDKLSDAEVDRMLELFADPEWAALSPVIFAAWGRRVA
jgi:SAM-dependent methyltransferase